MDAAARREPTEPEPRESRRNSEPAQQSLSIGFGNKPSSFRIRIRSLGLAHALPCDACPASVAIGSIARDAHMTGQPTSHLATSSHSRVNLSPQDQPCHAQRPKPSPSHVPSFAQHPRAAPRRARSISIVAPLLELVAALTRAWRRSGSRGPPACPSAGRAP